MVDTHCHLNFKAFEEDLDEVIESAFEKGVTKIINVGAMLDSSKKAVELAEKYDSPAGELFATVGIHPHHADKVPCHPELDSGSLDIFWREFEKLAKHPKVVAIGECGMDYFSYKSNDVTNPKLQKELFIKQIQIANKLKLPLQIHNRQAGKDVIQVLSEHKSLLLNKPGVFHCFSGDIELLKRALDLGFFIGFDGNITYKGIAKGETISLSELAKYTPTDRILIETDAPYLTPIPYRGEKNKPEYAIITAQFIAKLKGLEFEELEAQTDKNAKEIFNF